MTISAISDYQKWTIETAVYPEAGWKTDRELNYLVMGIVGEAGELANSFKKLIRNGDIDLEINSPIVISREKQENLCAELGDVLWYLARLCETLDIDLVDLAVENRMKLEDRKLKDQLKKR